jgi:hypothetical protein
MYISYAYVTLSLYGYLDPTIVENRIWGDGIGTSRCDVDSSRLLSGAMLEAYG